MTLRKVLMLPTPNEARRDTTNSINQIVLRLEKTLPQFGWQLVERNAEADIVAAHAGQSGGVLACDVAHCHGLYPTQKHSDVRSWFAVNVNVIENLRSAKHITVPSEWVGDIIRRNLVVEPSVIPWAIDMSEWEDIQHEGYTLWNKTRPDAVCDPLYVQRLAEAIPNAHFVSTFYPNDASAASNVDIIGRKPFHEMREVIKKSSLYLATTKETFGIGILEAMACKIPILGFDWGAVPDFVEHGVHGFLAAPGDIQGLIDGWHYCMTHRNVLGENAYKRAQEFQWNNVAEEFASIYDSIYREKSKPLEIDVSVVIPNYNYAQYLPQAIDSVLSQETNVSVELIVVDDGSTDDSDQLLEQYIQNLKETLPGFIKKFNVIFQENLGVSAARNTGISSARGKYIICLDADDLFGAPNYIELLYRGIEADPCLGIVYTGLGLLNKGDSTQYSLSNWPTQFDADTHFRNHNQVPTCNMFRKEAWEKALGYKFYAEPSEDAELWSRMLVMGYKAKQITADPIFYYRWHAESLSNDIRTGAAQAVNWLYFHPWAKTGKYPFASVTTPPKQSYPVSNYDNPVISIIIPVGPNHVNYLKRSLDSVWAQTFDQWECIVINDTGQDISEHVYPWVKLINPAQKALNTAQARNIGVSMANAPLITFLDADDYFDPTYLELTYKHFARYGRYIYSDWVSLKTDGSRETGKASEYSTEKVFHSHILHTINILLPKQWFDAIGGFDEGLDTWEDVELFMNLAAHGFCGKRLPKALTFYDYASGTLREKALLREAGLKDYLVQKYGQFMGPEAEMCSCTDIEPNMSEADLLRAAMSGEMIRVVYQGAAAKQTVIGPTTKQNYGRRQAQDIFYVWLDDYKSLTHLFTPAPVTGGAVLKKTELPVSPVLK